MSESTPTPKVVVTEKEPTPGRKPLYEPKYRNQLPARPPKPPSRWPKIKLPPIKRVPWTPPALIPKPEPQKQKIERTARLGRTFQPASFLHLAKSWKQFRQITKDMFILSGSYSQASKKFGFFSNNKQDSAIAVVASAFRKSRSMNNWTNWDIDRIIDEGDILYRLTVREANGKHPVKPNQIRPIFGWDQLSCSVIIGAESVTEDSSNEKATIKSLCKQIAALLGSYDATILSFNGNAFAIWKVGTTFYLFNSHDCDENGFFTTIRQGIACCVRLCTESALYDYLRKILKQSEKYELFSLKILSVKEIEFGDDISKRARLARLKKTEKPLVLPEESDTTLGLTGIECEGAEEDDIEEDSDWKPDADSIVEEAEAEGEMSEAGDEYDPDRHKKFPTILSPRPVAIPFSKDFRTISKTRGILRGLGHMGDVLKMHCANASALTVLHLARSFTWSQDTMADILDLADTIYENSLNEKDDNEGCPEVSLAEVMPPITYNKYQLALDVENVVYGQLGSKNPAVPDLERGLQNFFKVYDCGCLIGPQSVGIWQEAGFYFMFDPKERDHMGRKWYAREEQSLVSVQEDSGKSCLLWFRELSDLINIYTGNVPLKYRQDPFKLARVDVIEYIPKSNDWNHWKGFDLEKWILRARIYGEAKLSAYYAAIALGWNRLRQMNEWTKVDVEEILRLGTEFKTWSEKKYKKNHQLNVKELSKKFNISAEQKFFFLLEDCFATGFLLCQKIPTKEDDPSYLCFEKAMKRFFFNFSCGVVDVNRFTLPIWKRDEHYFMFDPLPRDSHGTDPEIFDNQEGILGVSCVLRFKNIVDMVQLIVANFSEALNAKFEIYPMDVEILQSTERPNLLNYSEWGAMGAILRPAVPNYHEGHIYFDLRRNKQNLCNLVVGLGMATIYASAKWGRSEVEEILKIGDKNFCQISKKSDSKEEFVLQWDHIRESILIGTSKFKITWKRVQGTFQPVPAEMKEAASAEEIASAGSVTSDKSASKISFKSHISRSSLKSIDYNEFKYDLQQIIENVIVPEDKILCILESDLFNISIWKQDELYFVFDSKATDDECILTKSRFKEFEVKMKKRELNKHRLKKEGEDADDEGEASDGEHEVDEVGVKLEDELKTLEEELKTMKESDEVEEGSAYVAWFTGPADLLKQILLNVTKGHEYDVFTLSILEFAPKVSIGIEYDVAMDWHNFKYVNNSSGHWIIRASISQNDHMFPKLFNRNNQDSANCITAIAVGHFCMPPDWNSIILDAILKYGDRLYSKSLMKYQSEQDTTSRLMGRKLALDEMCPEFSIENVKFTVEISAHLEGDVNAVPKSATSLTDTLDRFLNDGQPNYGVLMLKSYGMAVWKKHDSIFLFDPHDLGPLGQKRRHGVAALSRFIDVQRLVDVLQANFSSSVGYFELFKIDIKTETISIDFAPDCTLTVAGDQLLPYYSAFTDHGQGVQVLQGSIVEADASIYPRKFSASYGLASLAMTQVHRSQYWTSRIMDEVLVLGARIYNLTNENRAGEIDTCGDNVHPTQLIRYFLMGDNLVSVQMEIASKGLIESKATGDLTMKSGLANHFEANGNHAFLLTKSMLTAVWTECNRFFVYYPPGIGQDCGKGVSGRMCDDGKSCLMVFDTFKRFYGNLFRNIECRKDNEQERLNFYEIFRCDFKLTPIKKTNPLASAPKGDVAATSVVDQTKQSRVQLQHININQTDQKRLEEATDCRKEAIKRVKSRNYRQQGFVLIPDGICIIRGRLAKNNSAFHIETHNRHTAAIILVAAGYMHRAEHNPRKWSPQIIDSIIKSGHLLYKDAVATTSKIDADFNSINKRFYVENSLMQLSHKEFSGQFPFHKLELALTQLFRQKRTGYIKFKEQILMVHYCGDGYEYFDPNNCGFLGQRVENGAACLLEFQTLFGMCVHIRDKFPYNEEDSFEVGGLSVVYAG